MDQNKGEWKIIAQDSTAKQKEQRTANTTGSADNTSAQDHAARSKEPIARAVTTDSSRVPKNPNDDVPAGGNIR